MKEMYYMLGLAGWIWLALVAPLMIGFGIVKWHQRRGPRAAGFDASPKDGRPAGGEETELRRIEQSDEANP
jgi:hypothetical protein